MIEEFETEALRYLLDELDAPHRTAFEEKMTRLPLARAAVADLAESLAVLRRQARDFPSFGGVVHAEIARVLQAASRPRRVPFRWSVQKLRRLVA